MTVRQWAKGDKVIHAGCPEWGEGEVTAADSIMHEGKACQRLTVRFQRAGTKTLSTAFADLKPAEWAPRLSQAAVDLDSTADALATTATAAEVARLMTRLPENATDPFLPLRKRLEATLGVYRYGDAGPSGLLDWAAIQTGLKDPLSRFNRHELEQWFSKFRIDLDEHLKKLAREMRRADAKTLDEIIAKSTGGAKQALRRVDLGR